MGVGSHCYPPFVAAFAPDRPAAAEVRLSDTAASRAYGPSVAGHGPRGSVTFEEVGRMRPGGAPKGPWSGSPLHRCPEGGPEFRRDLDGDLDAQVRHQLLELTQVLLLGVDATPVVGQLQNRQLLLLVNADSAVGDVRAASQRADLNWTMSTILIWSLTLRSSASSSVEGVVARRLG